MWRLTSKHTFPAWAGKGKRGNNRRPQVVSFPYFHRRRSILPIVAHLLVMAFRICSETAADSSGSSKNGGGRGRENSGVVGAGFRANRPNLAESAAELAFLPWRMGGGFWKIKRGGIEKFGEIV